MLQSLSTLHEHALDMLEQADMALAHAPELPIDEVHKEEQITSDWLGEVLSEGVPGASLVQAECVEGHDGMTQRRRWQIEWNVAGKAAGLPEHVFIKATPKEPYLRETLAMLHMAEHEVRFYDTLQPDLTDISPKGFYGRYYPGGRFILVTEELESEGKRPFWLHDTCTIEHARAVCTALARLHARFWETPRFGTDLGWVRPRLEKFGRKWHRASYDTARAKYAETDFGQAMPDEVRQILELWSRDCLKVYDYWATLPQTVLHGDSHFGNTYAMADGRAGFFDWQVIFRGHCLRDVTYFLGSALSNEDRIAHEAGLLDHYLEQLTGQGVTLDRARAVRDFNLLSLERFDAHMKTHVFGGYGHTEDARRRGRDAVFGGMVDNGVLDLLKHVLKHGSLA